MSFVSDNYVKRNLKRKFHGQSFRKSKKFESNQKTRKGNDQNWKENSTNNNNNNNSEQNEQSGLSSWGIDPLNLSLGKLKGFNHAKSETSESKKVVNRRPPTPAPVRGLVCEEAIKETASSSRYTEEEIQYFNQYCPKCTGHQMTARLYLVRKSGGNRGRYFYSCTYPADQRCNFFLWVESAQEYALQCYERKLSVMTKDQIIQEVKNMNQRIIANRADLDGSEEVDIFPTAEVIQNRKTLLISKSKEELIQSLLREAEFFLQSQEEIKSKLKKYLPVKCERLVPPVDINVRNSNAVKEVIREGMIELSDSESDCDDEENDEIDEFSPLEVSKEESQNFSIAKEELLRRSCQWYFGYSQFRQGQSWAIHRCLEGRKSLLIMPTGYGKSLCYILPSLLLSGITIVISPLIALMNDQIMKLPPELPAVCLNSHLSTKQTAEACLAILENQMKIIFISPEKFCSNSFRNLTKQLHNRYGKDYISLLCIDEAHCLSHWSYHFRPAFLRIYREIDHLQPRSILALTATASQLVCQDILQHIQIISSSRSLQEREQLSASNEGQTECLQRINEVRQNLFLAAKYCDSENEKMQLLVRLLSVSVNKKTPPYFRANHQQQGNSNQTPLTIVYVWRRKDAEVLNDYLKALGIETVVYHGGLDHDRRELIQKQFDRGNARCIIATVAFGMGIDKQDIRQVIHYSLPKSIENYLQEIGRAGRDGQPSSCGLLYSAEETILQYNYSFTSQISCLQIFCLFIRLFPYSPPASTSSSSSPNFSLNILDVAQQLDISDSLLETTLSLLELPPFSLLRLDRNHYDSIVGKFRFLQEKYDKLMISKKELEQAKQDQSMNPPGKLANLNYQLLQKRIIQLIHNLNELRLPHRNSNSMKSKKLPKFLSSVVGNEDIEEEDAESFEEEYGENENQDSQYSLFEHSSGVFSTPTSSSFLQDFRISKTLLANELHLSLDEVCDLLYQLQKNGLLEYQLKQPHFYVRLQKDRLQWNSSGKGSTTSSSSSSSSSTTISGSPQSEIDYLNFLYNLSKQVFERLAEIQSDSTKAVVKMFKIAQLISKHSPASTDKDEIIPLKGEHLQNTALHEFVLKVLNSETLNSSSTVSDLEKGFWEDYQFHSLPFTQFPSSSAQIQLGVEKRMMENDLMLSQYFQYLYDLVVEDLSGRDSSHDLKAKAERVTKLQEIFQKERKSFFIQYMMKMFYGFPSHFLTLNGMKGEISIYAELWNKYRFYDYQQIHQLLHS